METFAVETHITFKGVFKVKTENKEQATEYVEKHCGLIIGRVHTSLSKECVDWEFDVHPNKEIKSVKPLKNKSV